jgi:hypothetical protein
MDDPVHTTGNKTDIEEILPANLGKKVSHIDGKRTVSLQE